MKEYIPKFAERLLAEPNIDNWRKLAKLTGSRLKIFNRRRDNETYNLLITRFVNRRLMNRQVFVICGVLCIATLLSQI